jgi:hypothetical protein
MPYYLNVFDAMQAGVIPIHEEHPNNIGAEVYNEFGI